MLPSCTGDRRSNEIFNFELTAIESLTELRALQALYRQDWPAHCVGYYCLDNFIRWLTLKPNIKNLNIYTLNGDWRSDGLFLIVDRYQLFLCTLKTDKDGGNYLLAKALSLLDWSGGFKVSSFLQRYREAVLNVVREQHLKLEYDDPTHLYFMPKEEALHLPVNCPTGYYLKSLALEDAAIVNDNWPNRHVGSLFFIKRAIAWNVNMGVYADTTHDLVAWCVRLQGGFLGALQVKDTHKRLGLGSLVLCAISKRLAELEEDVMALVGLKNIASCSMFDKLGFRVIDTCYWLRTYPTKDNAFWQNDNEDDLKCS